MRRATGTAAAAALLALLLAGCGDDDAAGGGSGEDGASGDDARVDLGEPVFTTPGAFTNPLFPVTVGDQVVQLGEEEGKPLRVEVTTLPRTQAVEWDGRRIDAVVSQYIAYRAGRIVEVAEDYYAQADDGSVWYLGEVVDNYEDGVVADHEGSWLAGEDGPGGMIMPAEPREGDVYRPENIPDVVFEEVTVQAVDVTVDGPSGPVVGAIEVEEHLMDGTVEGKVFAPGYGEFRAEAPDELVTVAVAVPTDAVTGELSRHLTTLLTSAETVFDQLPAADWSAVDAVVEELSAAGEAVRAGGGPELLATQLGDTLGALADAVDGRDAAAARQAAVDTATAALDLTLLYRPPAEVDRDRLEVLARQVLVDAAAGDEAGLRSDVAVLDTIRDRLGDLAPAVDAALAALRSAVDMGDVDGVEQAAMSLREVI